MALTGRNFQVRSVLKVVLECWDREILACIMNFHNRVTQPHLLDQIWTWHFLFGNSSESCQHFFSNFVEFVGQLISTMPYLLLIFTQKLKTFIICDIFISHLWTLENALFKDMPKWWNYRKYLTTHSSLVLNKALYVIIE